MSTAKSPTADTQIIPKAITHSIGETFRSMASQPTELMGVQLEDPTVEPGVGIISLIGVKGDHYHGTIAIHFPESTYVPLMNQVLGEKHAKICPDNADGASEFLNIIYASARVSLNEHGFNFQPAIPTTLRGEKLELPAGPKVKILKLRYQCPLGPFVVLVGLAPK